MIVYRISKTRFARDLTGEGARLYGGRWNHQLTPCLYTSGSRSLALLEYTVNVNAEDMPRTLSMVTLDIPGHKIFVPPVTKLPRNWQEIPAPAATRDYGTFFLRSMSHLAVRLPSTVIPEEFNYIINPLHPDSRLLKIVSISAFIYDVRLKTD